MEDTNYFTENQNLEDASELMTYANRVFSRQALCRALQIKDTSVVYISNIKEEVECISQTQLYQIATKLQNYMKKYFLEETNLREFRKREKYLHELSLTETVIYLYALVTNAKDPNSNVTAKNLYYMLGINFFEYLSQKTEKELEKLDDNYELGIDLLSGDTRKFRKIAAVNLLLDKLNADYPSRNDKYNEHYPAIKYRLVFKCIDYFQSCKNAKNQGNYLSAEVIAERVLSFTEAELTHYISDSEFEYDIE